MRGVSRHGPAANSPAGNGVGMELNFDRYRVVSFDCYGTLVNWEPGIVRVLRPILAKRGLGLGDDAILESFGRFETAAVADGYVPYTDVLRRTVDAFGEHFGFPPSSWERNALVKFWRHLAPFTDTRRALSALAARYRLAVVSNIDDALFAHTAASLGIEFRWLITAQQVRAYKPSPKIFEQALASFGVDSGEVLHVAQSLFHDIAPAKRLGLATVRINRRHGRSGFGATPPAHALPDLEVPDLDTLVRLSHAR